MIFSLIEISSLRSKKTFSSWKWNTKISLKITKKDFANVSFQTTMFKKKLFLIKKSGQTIKLKVWLIWLEKNHKKFSVEYFLHNVQLNPWPLFSMKVVFRWHDTLDTVPNMVAYEKTHFK